MDAARHRVTSQDSRGRLPSLEKMKVRRETGGRLRQTETDLINNCTDMKSKWLKHVA
ncbi:hypothetical protein JOB18_029856 [Solea senegalensis]|uniref:Uncharacterized protein n=1 Tax=Solea senegalensis TaxID=28829 RepID=A0AAV6QVP1_SOLSE|nr:hypothetical protein JOB18_029856 [Solea senegalensis]